MRNTTKPITLSHRTRLNWLVDAALFLSAVIAMLSGIYFLYLPSGYQGGRNPLYDVTILFNRSTWSDLHTWGGVIVIVVVTIHLSLHWQWIKTMSKRALTPPWSSGSHLSRGAKMNVAVNATIAASFLFTAASGMVLLFTPSGPRGKTATFLFDRTTWDLIHTWAGVAMIIALLMHLAIHWRWIKNVTGKALVSLWQRSAPQSPSTPSRRYL
jgi:hypothetical protein